MLQTFCSYCRGGFETVEELLDHKATVHYSNSGFALVEECHEDSDNPGEYNKGAYVKPFPPSEVITVAQAFGGSSKEEIRDICDYLAGRTGSVLVRPSLHVMAAENDGEGNITNLHKREIYTPGHFSIHANAPDTEQIIMSMLQELEIKVDELENTVGSGFSLVSIEAMKLNFDKRGSLRGSRWLSTAGLSHKTSTLNIKNTNDDLCLLYSIAAHIFPPSPSLPLKKREDPNTYKHYLPLFDTSDLSFPLKGSQEIESFVKKNERLDFELTIFKTYNSSVYPVFSTIKRDCKEEKTHHVRLLEVEGYIQPSSDNPKPQYTSHYVLVTDFNKYMRKFYDEDGKSSDKTKTCPSCLKYKTRNDNAMHKHRKGCDKSGTGQQFEVSDGDHSELKFRNPRAKFQTPLMGTADFETTVTPGDVCGLCKELYFSHLKDDQIRGMTCYHTTTFCKQLACQYKKTCPHKLSVKEAHLKAIAHHGVVFMNDGTIFDEATHYGENCSVGFLQHLVDNIPKYTEYISQNIPRKKLTAKQLNLYHQQRTCGERWCSTELDRRVGGNIEHRPVVDHDHLR